jgi:putative flippase GtrA
MSRSSLAFLRKDAGRSGAIGITDADGISASTRIGMWQNACQLLKFCTVGASGYLVNLTVYAALSTLVGLNLQMAAVCAFLVAVGNNYVWNRIWTFSGVRSGFAAQGLRFLTISISCMGVGLVILTVLTGLGLGSMLAQSSAIALVTPLSFLGNKSWTFSS